MDCEKSRRMSKAARAGTWSAATPAQKDVSPIGRVGPCSAREASAKPARLHDHVCGASLSGDLLMATWLVIVVTVIYAVTAVSLGLKGQWGPCVMFAGYSIANVGIIWWLP